MVLIAMLTSSVVVQIKKIHLSFRVDLQ